MIGRLRHRLVLEVLSTSADGGGGVADEWHGVATIWAAISPARGFEESRGGKPESQMGHKILMRYRADLVPTMRFRDGTRIFTIQTIRNVEERGVYQEVRCVERVVS